MPDRSRYEDDGNGNLSRFAQTDDELLAQCGQRGFKMLDAARVGQAKQPVDNSRGEI